MVIITLGGDPGSGKSTLGKQLAALLGIPYFSSGLLFRKLARDEKVSLEEFQRRVEENPEHWDKKIDAVQQQLPKEHAAFILDSRLGFHFVPESLKIYLSVAPEEAARRLLDQHREDEHWRTIKDAVKDLTARKESERRRFMQLYGVDHHDVSNYDIVLDTTTMTVDEKQRRIVALLRQRGVKIDEKTI